MKMFCDFRREIKGNQNSNGTNSIHSNSFRGRLNRKLSNISADFKDDLNDSLNRLKKIANDNFTSSSSQSSSLNKQASNKNDIKLLQVLKVSSSKRSLDREKLSFNEGDKGKVLFLNRAKSINQTIDIPSIEKCLSQRKKQAELNLSRNRSFRADGKKNLKKFHDLCKTTINTEKSSARMGKRGSWFGTLNMSSIQMFISFLFALSLANLSVSFPVPSSSELLLLSDFDSPAELASALPAQTDDSSQMLAIQRRRLERDRALEPPAWLRTRPIRSFINQQEQNFKSENKIQKIRHSRQLTDLIYNELIKQLIETALENENIFNQFNLNIKTKSKSKLDSNLNLNEPKFEKQENVLIPNEFTNLQENSNSELPLILDGDEVSENDDDINIDTNSQQIDNLNSQKLLQEEEQSNIIKANDENSNLNNVNIIEKLNSDKETNQDDYSNLDDKDTSASFHIIEDIDLTEDSHGSPQQNSIKQQQQIESYPDEQIQRIDKRDSIDYETNELDNLIDNFKDDDFLIEQPEKRIKKEFDKNTFKEQSLIKMIEFGLLNKNQLIQAAKRLRYFIEDILGLARLTILGLFPTESDQLLIQLDQTKLTIYDYFKLTENFGYSKGFILINWPKESPQNPLPLLKAILKELYENELEQQQQSLDESSSLEDQIVSNDPVSIGHLIRTEPIYFPFSQQDFLNQAQLNEDKQEQQIYKDYLIPNSSPLIGLPSHINDLNDDMSTQTVQEFWQPKTLNLDRSFPLLSSLVEAYLNKLYSDRAGLNLASRKLEQTETNQNENQQNFFKQANLMQFMSILIILICVYLILKLIFKTSNERKLLSHPFHLRGSIRSIWSSSSNSDTQQKLNESQLKCKSIENFDTKVSDESSKSKQKSQASNDEIYDSISQKSFERLTQKLLNILNYQSSIEKFKTKDGSKSENDKIVKGEKENSFRTSKSYIRSLIEAITKSKQSVPPMKTGFNLDDATKLNCNKEATNLGDDDDDDDDDDDNEAENEYDDEKKSNEIGNVDKIIEDEGNEIVTSQMDISAAHLILAYMEKHIDDKEHLRKEWLELNNSIDPANQHKNNAKLNRLILERLAKVALNEENLYKNKNPLVVPFDWNRVKLGSLFNSELSLNENTDENGNINTKEDSNISRQNRFHCNKESKLQEDYINASYIYDDEPRKATYIIAQGPIEQTVGQFWQMIWEQEISVIVMLTRLNEDNIRMCQCYWPTKASLVKSSLSDAHQEYADTSIKQTGTNVNGSCSSPPIQFNGRRPSMTSVLNGTTCRQTGNGQSIITNGQVIQNVLHFELSSGTQSASNTSSKTNEKDEKNHIISIKLQVHLVSEHVTSADYLVRNMFLVNLNTNETRTISQFHYLAWPQNGVPENVKSFLEFRRKVHKSYRNSKSPILVHCSDGAGRSGTYTLIDIILERIKNGAKEIDPRATLEHLRDQRIGSCSNLDQFEFVLVALAEEIQIILNALPH